MQSLDSGRVGQKARTRTILLTAALAMIREGAQPSVEEVAQATGISKRTAYRYFTSREHLLADAALDGLRPKLAEIIDSVRGADVVERLASLVRALHALTITYEAELRTMMRFALEAALDPRRKDAERVRGRRRIDWIETALAPMRELLLTSDYERLVSALCVCIGIDSFLVLRDIRGLPERQIEDVVLWMCRALLAESLPR
jgi:AcrR family transcriptional regulator